MTASSIDDLTYQAARLAFAQLRFADGAAHPDRSSTPHGILRTGIDCQIFAPSWRRIPVGDVPRFLAGLPSPAMLMPSTTRGIATMLLLDELAGERRAWAEKAFANQQEGLASAVRSLSLNADSRFVLQFDDEEFWYPLSVLEHCLTRFGVSVGWNMWPYADDGRAQARLMLNRSDGVLTWGDACPIRKYSAAS
jgi:hypothetical protein